MNNATTTKTFSFLTIRGHMIETRGTSRDEAFAEATLRHPTELIPLSEQDAAQVTRMTAICNVDEIVADGARAAEAAKDKADAEFRSPAARRARRLASQPTEWERCQEQQRRWDRGW